MRRDPNSARIGKTPVRVYVRLREDDREKWLVRQSRLRLERLSDEAAWQEFVLRQMRLAQRDIQRGTRTARECARHLAKKFQRALGRR